MGKIGEGHAEAMGRLGMKELRNAMNPSRESAADSEIGLYGTMTQGEIAQARGSYGMDAEQEKAVQTEQGKEQPQPTQEAAQQEAPAQEAPQQEQQTSVLGYPLESGGQEQSQQLAQQQQQSRGRGR